MRSHKLKQKHIQDFLQDVDDFKFGEKQKINLQQHMTPPNIAAKLLFYVFQNQQVQTSIIADIGVGTGMLICGAIYLQPQFVLGFQIDQQYIASTRELLEEKVQGADYDLIHADIRNMRFRQKQYDRLVDIVIMNPPFGTKQAGIDMIFLQFAMKICEGNIYSMHKTSTRKFINNFCQQRGYTMDVLFQVKFPLKKRFKGYHKKEVGQTQVDIILVKPTKQLIESRIKKLQQSAIEKSVIKLKSMNLQEKQINQSINMQKQGKAKQASASQNLNSGQQISHKQ